MIHISPTVGKAMATQVKQVNGDDKERRQALFAKVVATFQTRQQWPTSHEETIMEGNLTGRQARVYLKNDGGVVRLYIYRQGRSLAENFVSEGFTVGVLTGSWELAKTATDAEFSGWYRKVWEKIGRMK